MVVDDVVTGDLGQEDGGVPADMTGSVLGSVGISEPSPQMEFKTFP